MIKHFWQLLLWFQKCLSYQCYSSEKVYIHFYISNFDWDLLLLSYTFFRGHFNYELNPSKWIVSRKSLFKDWYKMQNAEIDVEIVYSMRHAHFAFHLNWHHKWKKIIIIYYVEGWYLVFKIRCGSKKLKML